MKKLLLSMALVLSAVGMQAQDSNFWIYLCIGQSNMAGKAPIEKQDSVMPDNVVSLACTNGPDRQMGQWRKALPPIVRSDSKLSLLTSFGRTMAKYAKGKKIGLVPVAIEGCPIIAFDKDRFHEYTDSVPVQWAKDILLQYNYNPYNRLIEMARIAQKDGVIKGILLHQGETDAYTPEWNQEVKKIYYNIINDLKLDSTECPLIVGEVGRAEYGGQHAVANKTINRMHKVLQHAYVVSSVGCPISKDHIHFSAEGYRNLGKRYAVKTLQGMGFEVTNDNRTETVTDTRTTQKPQFVVRYHFTEEGNIVATGSCQIYQVEIQDVNGKTLETFNYKKPDMTATVDLNDFPEKTRLNVIFRGTNGGEQSVGIK